MCALQYASSENSFLYCRYLKIGGVIKLRLRLISRLLNQSIMLRFVHKRLYIMYSSSVVTNIEGVSTRWYIRSKTVLILKDWLYS